MLYYSTFESLQCYIRDCVYFVVILLGDSKPFTTTLYTNTATTVCLMMVYSLSSTSGCLRRGIFCGYQEQQQYSTVFFSTLCFWEPIECLVKVDFFSLTKIQKKKGNNSFRVINKRKRLIAGTVLRLTPLKCP